MTTLLSPLGELTRPNVLELSRRLGVARNTVQARLDRLQESGVIIGWGPVVDLKAMGYDVLAFVTLEIAQGQEQAALAELTAIPEVLEIHKTTGPGDLICRVVARSNDHLHVVLEQVLAAPGVQRTTSSLALNSPKLRVHPDAASVDDLAQ
jgi:DNA-binding Lrp family transcriptional regulator